VGVSRDGDEPNGPGHRHAAARGRRGRAHPQRSRGVSHRHGEIAWNAIDHIEPFLEFSRNHEIPVTYTRVVPSSYDDPNHEDLDIVDAVAPKEGETVINKSYASAFYGTDLLSRLVRGGHDSVIIVGNSTSGCVRATAIDAQQNGFNVVLPQECVFDRIEASHKIALMDLWMKYAEVLERDEVESWVGIDE